MKNLISAALIISLFVFQSCSQEKLKTESIQSLDSLIIISGQSFGFCVGKCYSDMIFKGKNVSLIVKETVSKGNSNIQKETTYTDELTDKQLSELAQLIDLGKFKLNPETIGCPDCADGGAEWLAIEQTELNKKVTFEYGKDIPGQEKLVAFLRKERTTLLTKFVKE